MIDIRNQFVFLNILRTNRLIETNFVITVSLTKSTFRLLIVFLHKFATELWSLFDVRIYFFFNILRTNKPNETKFCIHIIFVEIYFGIIVKRYFLHICNKTTALARRHNSVWLILNIEFQNQRYWLCAHPSSFLYAATQDADQNRRMYGMSHGLFCHVWESIMIIFLYFRFFH